MKIDPNNIIGGCLALSITLAVCSLFLAVAALLLKVTIKLFL